MEGGAMKYKQRNIEKRKSVDFLQAQRYILSSIFGPQQTQSVSENAISSPCTVQFSPFILSSRVILSIYCFKRDNFLSENVIFESKTRLAYKSSSKSAKRCLVPCLEARSSELERARARASESSTCFPCWKSNKLMLFWRELF